jgi:hypothetical protein
MLSPAATPLRRNLNIWIRENLSTTTQRRGGKTWILAFARMTTQILDASSAGMIKKINGANHKQKDRRLPVFFYLTLEEP